MNKKIYFVLSPVVAFFLYLTLSSYSGGITGQSVAGCSCHNPTATAGTLITLTGLPAGGYVNGSVYPVTLTITNTSVISVGVGRRDGFDMTSSAGAFTAIAGTALNGPTEIRHTTPKPAPAGTASWTFNWTAPASGSAAVSFNIAGNAANGDGSPSSLDKWNSFSTTLIKAPPYTVSATASTILCNGGTASITATSINGSAPFQYKLNTGLYQSISTFPSLSSGTYTITGKDATNATATTVVTINQPSIINFGTSSIVNPVCNGGAGTASFPATGGTGILTYSITPSGPQTNTTGNFNSLIAQTYTVTVSDGNSCTKTTSFSITQPAPLVVTSSNVSGCQGSPVTLIGSPAGGVFSVSNPYTGPSTTYTYSYTNGSGCSATSSPSSITINPVSSSSIVMPASGSYCETLTQVSGTNMYSNSSCQLISTISGSGLGNTNACVNFLTGSPSWNGEPYANRVYSITPTTLPSSAVNLCLYYTLADLASAGITSTTDISITNVAGNGALGGTGMVTEIPNSSMFINSLFGGNIEVCFPTTTFSSFYLHSKNPGNVPLPVSLSQFSGASLADADKLNWLTKNELNNNHFNVQHSTDGIQFKTIARIQSRAENGNSTEELKYDFTNYNTLNSYNFYRLEQVDINGQSAFSGTVSLFRSLTENSVNIFPNPTTGKFNITSFNPIQISIFDLNGKLVSTKKESINSEIELGNKGIYIIRITDKYGVINTRKLIVE